MNISLDKEQIELVQKKIGITLNKIQSSEVELSEPVSGIMTTMSLGEEHIWS